MDPTTSPRKRSNPAEHLREWGRGWWYIMKMKKMIALVGGQGNTRTGPCELSSDGGHTDDQE